MQTRRSWLTFTFMTDIPVDIGDHGDIAIIIQMCTGQAGAPTIIVMVTVANEAA
ncbi:hypothetical protein [Legionella jamestowniensis]|uniref:hypothetical protein n=1 Tax=Legionella jamestowniensis TaxID=455 RepID=UPI0013EF917D|nr:hypothetical protein [Legionella jamestowniensis]